MVLSALIISAKSVEWITTCCRIFHRHCILQNMWQSRSSSQQRERPNTQLTQAWIQGGGDGKGKGRLAVPTLGIASNGKEKTAPIVINWYNVHAGKFMS